MPQRIDALLRGNPAPIGTILAPSFSPGPTVESTEFEGLKVVLKRHLKKIISIEFRSIDDAKRWPGFKATKAHVSKRENAVASRSAPTAGPHRDA